jgi:hypothetical protein
MKGAALNAEIGGEFADSLVPTMEEWFRIVEAKQAPPPDPGEFDLEATSEGLQDIFSDQTRLTVEHSSPDASLRVFTVDNISLFLSDNPRGSLFAKLIRMLWALVPAGIAIFLNESTEARDKMIEFTQGLLKRYTDQLLPKSEVTPDRALEEAGRMLAVAIKTGVEAQAFASSLEVITQGTAPGIGQFAGIIATFAGFGPIAGKIYGDTIGASIGRPLGYDINDKTRTKRPNEGQLIEGATERKISLEEMRTELHFQGYNDRWVDFIQQYMWRDPRLREIVLLASDSSVTQADVSHWLREAGYDDNDVDRMEEIVMDQAMRTQRQTYLNEVMTSYREGLATETELDGAFDILKMQPQARDLLRITANRMLRREIVDEHRHALETQFAQQLITLSEFRLSLEALGYSGEKVDGIVARVLSSLQGRLVREEKADVEAEVRRVQSVVLQSLRQQFQFGEINAVTLLLLLQQAGFSEAFAREITSLEVIKSRGELGEDLKQQADRLKAQIVALRRDTFVAQFRKGQISIEQLRALLLALKIPPALVDAIIEAEKIKIVKSPAPRSTAR